MRAPIFSQSKICLHKMAHSKGHFYSVQTPVARNFARLRGVSTELYNNWRKCSILFARQTSEAKNMADFGFCWRQNDATGSSWPWSLPLTNCGPYFKRSLRPPGFFQIFKDFFSFFRSISQKRSEFFFRRFCFIIRVPKLVLAVFLRVLALFMDATTVQFPWR